MTGVPICFLRWQILALLFTSVVGFFHSSKTLAIVGHDMLQSTLQASPYVLINYYADWCGYCKTVRHEFSLLSKEVRQQNIPVVIGEVDCGADGNKDLVSAEGVTGFPTIVLYKNGNKLGEYQGPRSTASIMSYLRGKVGIAATYVSTFDEVEIAIKRLDDDDYIHLNSLAVVFGLFLPPSANALGGSSGVVEAEISRLAGSAETNDEVPGSSLTEIQETFMNVAQSYDLATFFYSDNAQILERFPGLENSLLVFTDGSSLDTYKIIPLNNQEGGDSSMRNGDNIQGHSAPQLVTDEHIISEILVASIPPVVSFNSDVQPLIQNLPIKTHVLMFFDPDTDTEEEASLFLDYVEEACALKYRGSMLFLEVSSDEHQVLGFFGLTKADLPQILIADMSDVSNMKRYSFPDFVEAQEQAATAEHGDGKDVDKRTALENKNRKHKHLRMKVVGSDPSYYVRYGSEQLHAFFDGYLASTLQNVIRSEDTTSLAEANSGAFTVEAISADNFQQKVFGYGGQHPEANNAYDSLIFFHAPWCGHCKSMEPILAEIAAVYSRDPNIMVYRMDASKNDVPAPGVRLKSYPAVYLFLAQSPTAPIEFLGARSVEAVSKFIDQHHNTVFIDYDDISDVA